MARTDLELLRWHQRHFGVCVRYLLRLYEGCLVQGLVIIRAIEGLIVQPQHIAKSRDMIQNVVDGNMNKLCFVVLEVVHPWQHAKP